MHQLKVKRPPAFQIEWQNICKTFAVTQINWQMNHRIVPLLVVSIKVGDMMIEQSFDSSVWQRGSKWDICMFLLFYH